MSAVIDPKPPSEAKRRPFQGWGDAFRNGLLRATALLITLTGKLYGQARERSSAALTEFQARPEHSRWRAYALGSYGLIVAGTLLGQFYSENGLKAYVRVQPVDFPQLTQIFVRNDSNVVWNGVKVTLNDIYSYEKVEVKPGENILLPVDRFAVFDRQGHVTYAPKSMPLRKLSIDTREGHFETSELHP